MSKIVVVGSSMIDFTAYSQRLPKSGETIIGSKFEQGFGGKGANQCVTAARLEAATAFVTALGSDELGQQYIDKLKFEGIDVTYAKRKKSTNTGAAQITVAENGLSIVNAAPAVANIPPEIFKLADVFCINESEAESITGIENLTLQNVEKAVDKLLQMGCNTIIITLGSYGAVFASKENKKVKYIPADKVKPVDTTGAGDAFLGAFAYFTAYHANLSMEEIIKRSCKIATQSVLKAGTQMSFPRKKDLPANLFL
ncbi:ribokinase-like isoform X2 [Leptopilina heterotoma]|uniref:ribokinase-like isoform X2 n=1 Tax=Leptopilina heterotoma TaxID=63436 RepID=UPI001CA91555|nr:ribokinase-like isoform X2 [Leptopilina heterotoma]